MKKFLILFLLFGIQFSYVSCSKDNDIKPEQALEAETFMNVSYGSNPQQIYDIYLPANRSAAKTKVIVLVHGGGWTGGEKTEMDFLIPYIKLRHPNHAIVNMNYILANAENSAFPQQFNDIDLVLKKLKNEMSELQILPEFALIGASAGAHLALMYDYVYDTNDQVKMVVDIVGPTDFTDPYYSNNPGFPLLLAALVDESAYPENTDFPTILSPALQVSSKSSPTLLFYGNEDPLVPLSNGERLNNALTAAGIDHNFSVYQGGHGDNWSQADYDNAQEQMSDYINTYLNID